MAATLSPVSYSSREYNPSSSLRPYSPPATPRSCPVPKTSYSYSSGQTLVPMTPVSYTFSGSSTTLDNFKNVPDNHIATSFLWTSDVNSNNDYFHHQHHHHQQHTPVLKDYPANEVEFARLPAAVRRKQFSTLERLRLAQQSSYVSSSAVSKRPMTAIKKTDSRRSRDVFSSIVGSSSGKPKSRKGSKPNPTMTLDPFVLSQTDANWFLQLPDTVKRKHFTEVEREILQSRCEGVITKSNGTFPAHDVCHETLSQPNQTFSPPIDVNYTMQKCGELRENEHSFRNSISWLDDTDDLASKLTFDDYEDVLKPAAKALVEKNTKGHSRMPSLRRTFSISRNSIQSPTNHYDQSPSTPKPTTPTVSTTAMRPSHRPASHSLSIPNRRPYHQQRPSLDQDATYWQDPDARLKLRLYLASPQKFDEAIEFGFPSSKDDDALSLRSPTTPHYTEIVLDDAQSSSSSENSEPKSRKPSHLTICSNTTLSPPSPGLRSPLSPFSKPRQMSTFPLDVPNGREMTLRMTLTRPDLRADESELYGWQKNADPYALDELPPATADVYGTSGPFDAQQSKKSNHGFSRFWRKVKSGPRK